MRKAFLFVSISLFFLLFSCNPKTKRAKTPIDYITENTESLIKVDDWSLYEALKQTEFSRELRKETDELDKLLQHIQASKAGLILGQKHNQNLAHIVITPWDSLMLPKDETLYKISESNSIKEFTKEAFEFYSLEKDSLIFVSTNKEALENLLAEKKNLGNPKLNSLLQAKSQQAILSIHKNEDTEGLGEWSALDFRQTENSFLSSGVITLKDSLTYKSNLIKGQKPAPLSLAEITPISAKTAWALTYQDTEELSSQIESISGLSLSNAEKLIIESGDELASIQLKDEKLMVLKSLNTESTWLEILPLSQREDSYREIDLYKIENENLLSSVYKIICESNDALSYVAQVEEYFIFSNSKDILQEYISHLLNQHTLAKSSVLEQLNNQLSQSSSITHYNFDGELPYKLSETTGLKILGNQNAVSSKSFPIIVTQINADKSFLHFNLLAQQENKAMALTTGVSENLQIDIANGILNQPIYYTDYRSKSKNIVLQDQAFNLIAYSSHTGKQLWKKDLKSPVLGEIKEIDLYKNGRKQLAFTTEDAFYILDREGNEVKPFPIKFKDKVTQGLAVFDYSNNSDYRFVVIQGQGVLMYNKEAKIVRGFTYTKAKANLIMPPQHLRIGNKDYLLFAEENGKLNILDRVGKRRVSVAGTYDIKNQPIELENNEFTFYTNDLDKIQVSQAGKIKKQKLEESFYKTAKHNQSVFKQGNILRINTREIELPFGLYTDPGVFKINNQIYISITETQEHKLYMYNAQGNLMPGFPVYGSDKAYIDAAQKANTANILVKTEANKLVQYILNH